MKLQFEKRLGEGESMLASHTSDKYEALYIDRGAFQVTWSGADEPDGEFILEGSVEPYGNNFVPLPKGKLTCTTASGTRVVQLTDICYRWIRLRYVPNSVTAGTWDAYLILKGP